MALTTAIHQVRPAALKPGNLGIMTGTLTFDSSYPTGGEALSDANIDFTDYFAGDIKVFFEQQSGYLFEWDATNEKVKVYNPTGAGTTSTAAALTDLDVNIMDDDDAATKGSILYAEIPLGRVTEATLVSECANGATAYFSSDTGSIQFPVVYKTMADPTLNFIDDDSADSNGTQVYIVLDADGVSAKFVSNNAGNAESYIETYTPTDSILVDYCEDAAERGIPVYVDENETPALNRLQFVHPLGTKGNNVYVKTGNGRYLRIANDASAAGNGVALYFDDNGGVANQRFIFVSPTNTTASTYLDTQGGRWAVDQLAYYQVYVDDDGTTESERLLIASNSTLDQDIPVIGLGGGRSTRMLYLTYDADADSTGTAVYFDDDASEKTERLLSVTAGDDDTTVQMDPMYNFYFTTNHTHTISAESGDEVAASTNLSTVVVDFVVIGRLSK